jgi:hypothetical protein
MNKRQNRKRPYLFADFTSAIVKNRGGQILYNIKIYLKKYNETLALRGSVFGS